MPIRELSPEARESIRQQEIFEAQQMHQERTDRYAHELELARISAVVEGSQRTKRAWSKAFTWPVAVIVVYLLVRKDKVVPAILENFLTI